MKDLSDEEMKNVYEECMERRKMFCAGYVPQISFEELKTIANYTNHLTDKFQVDRDWIEAVLKPYDGIETSEQLKGMVDLAFLPYIEQKPWDRKEFRKKFRHKMSKRFRHKMSKRLIKVV